MQHKITKPSRLLNKRGRLIQKGYALSPILTYCRKDVARKLRLKEWDYYLIYNQKYAVALTVAQSVNIVLLSASFIDFSKAAEKTKSLFRIVSRKKFCMPESSVEGDILYQDSEVNLSFKQEATARKLNFKIKNFDNGTKFDASLELRREPKDSMVIATPFNEDPKDFYYNRKIIGMKAYGTVRYNGNNYNFLPMDTSAILDWGRGVWPYRTTWFWGVGQGTTWGNSFGFNLGYGFGNTSAASENMLFFNGRAHKINNVKFNIPTDKNDQYDYRKPWTITSSDHRLNMKFVPIIDRKAHLSALFLSTHQHQVFGRYSGTAILDDDTTIYFNNFMGFAERVVNRW